MLDPPKYGMKHETRDGVAAQCAYHWVSCHALAGLRQELLREANDGRVQRVIVAPEFRVCLAVSDKKAKFLGVGTRKRDNFSQVLAQPAPRAPVHFGPLVQNAS